MATYEIYVPERATMNADVEVTILGLEAEIAAAEKAGLTEQAARSRSELELRKRGLTPLTTDELGMWQRWFPTAYRTSFLHCLCGCAMVTHNRFARYSFDRVPTSVLELVAHCRDQYRLDWLEIRTPEQNRRQDPGLFGGKGPFTVLLARWGESDDRLLDFREIQAGLRARSEKDTLEFMAEIPLVIFGITSFIAGLIAIGVGIGEWVRAPLSAWYVGIAICLGPWSAYWFWRASRIRKIFAYAFS